MSMEFEAARALVRDHLAPLGSETVALQAALGRAAAEDLRTDRELPPFDRVAMDGYAVRAADCDGASLERPVRLKVVAAAYAGEVGASIGPGECARAMTGAPLPAGADAVVPVEGTAGYADDRAEIHRAVAAGDNFAPRGEDCPAGARILAAGSRILPHHVQALASTGHVELAVHRRPRAIVFATGDELVSADRTPRGAQIRESNGPSAQALLADAGITCEHGGILADRREALRDALEPALAAHELVVLSGGVSRGERDHVLEILLELGLAMHFTSLKLRPGHPAGFGTRGDCAVLALPGNPVAVVATLCAVFGPGLRRLCGELAPPPRTFARMDFAHRRRGDRTQLLPVSLHESEAQLPLARSVRLRGSGDFFALAQAQALAHLTTEREDFAAGDVVEILPLRI